jgi:hypothetical protein
MRLPHFVDLTQARHINHGTIFTMTFRRVQAGKSARKGSGVAPGLRGALFEDIFFSFSERAPFQPGNMEITFAFLKRALLPSHNLTDT